MASPEITKYAPEEEGAILGFIAAQATVGEIGAVQMTMDLQRDIANDFGRRIASPEEMARKVTAVVEREFSFNPAPGRAAALLTVAGLEMPIERRVALFHQSLMHNVGILGRIQTRAEGMGEDTLRTVNEGLIVPAVARAQTFEALTGLHTDFPFLQQADPQPPTV